MDLINDILANTTAITTGDPQNPEVLRRIDRRVAPQLTAAVDTARSTGKHGSKGYDISGAGSVLEALQGTGNGWRVECQPLHLPDGRPTGAQGVVRVDTGAILGSHVGERYRALQPAEALAWLDPMIAAGHAKPKTLMVHEGGARITMICTMGEDRTIVEKAGDTVGGRIVAGTSFDGGSSHRGALATIRALCTNMHIFSADVTSRFSVRHTANAGASLRLLGEAAARAGDQFAEVTAGYCRLAARPVSADRLREYITRLFPAPKKRGPVVTMEEVLAETERSANERAYDTIMGCFEHGRGNDAPGVRGTAWAALNAVTEYLTHERGRGSSADRLDYMVHGQGAGLGRRAYTEALNVFA